MVVRCGYAACPLLDRRAVAGSPVGGVDAFAAVLVDRLVPLGWVDAAVVGRGAVPGEGRDGTGGQGVTDELAVP